MTSSFAWPQPEEEDAPQPMVGDYELLEEIARGGMGVVYKARQTSLNRIVALKMILNGSNAQEELVQRFGEEASAAATLRHPNIVAVHEVGIHQNRHYFSMDYVEGTNLAALIRAGPQTDVRAAQCLKVVAEAMHHAHDHGVLHRDLKPANILIDLQGQPHITDFGLAKRFTTDDATVWSDLLSPEITGPGAAVGSPSFMAPEQASPHLGPLGRYTDVYALGAILYALLTGRPPFQADTPVATLRMVLDEEPLAPRRLCPAVPMPLETIVLKCLNKRPGHRYGTARELAEDLGRFLKGHPVRARLGRRIRRAGASRSGSSATALLLIGILFGAILITVYNHNQHHVLEQRLRNAHPGLPESRKSVAEPAPGRAPANGTIPPNRLELRNAAIAALTLSYAATGEAAEAARGPVFFETTLNGDADEDPLDSGTRTWIQRLVGALGQAPATAPNDDPRSPHLREIQAWSADGRLLALARVDGAIGVFHSPSWTEVARLPLPTSAAVSKLTFLDDDRAIVAVGDREEVFIWDLAEMRRRLARIGLDWPRGPAKDDLSSSRRGSVGE